MKRLMELGDRHANHLGYHLGQLWGRGAIEALFLLISAIVSLWMLRMQVNRGYQQLV